MISFVVPAHNEETRIEKTIDEILSACSAEKIENIEIIVVNDFSSDGTKNIVKKKIESTNSKIILYSNDLNIGFGGSIKQGFKIAQKEYVFWIPGDNAHPASEIKKILKFFKQNQNLNAISTYYTNTEKRNFFRQLFTNLYTPFLNLIFGLKLNYYNGLTLINKKFLDKINIKTNAHCWQVEMWVKLNKLNSFKYGFVPTLLFEDDKSTNVFKPRNSIKVLSVIIRLILYRFNFISS